MYEYMRYFEDAYCVFSLERFQLSQRKAVAGMKKVYAIDQGLITAVSLSTQFDMAAQLETAMFAYLRRFSEHLFFYRTHDGKEVDFVLLLPDQTLHLFQVTISMKDPHTYKREVSALVKAMEELEIDRGTIITLDEEGEIQTPQGSIRIMQVWKLFLENRWL